MAPNYADNIITIIAAYTAALPLNDPISNSKYLVYLGIVLIFVIIGSVVALKRRDHLKICLLSYG